MGSKVAKLKGSELNTNQISECKDYELILDWWKTCIGNSKQNKYKFFSFFQIRKLIHLSLYSDSYFQIKVPLPLNKHQLFYGK